MFKCDDIYSGGDIMIKHINNYKQKDFDRGERVVKSIQSGTYPN